MHAFGVQAESLERRYLVWRKNKVDALVEIMVPGVEREGGELLSNS
jgi:hypothetical protein